MKRGELYRVSSVTSIDPKKQRIYVVVSRQELIDWNAIGFYPSMYNNFPIQEDTHGYLHSAYSTLICAPVYSNVSGLSTEVPVGVEEGLKHHSAIRCDELISILKSRLTDYVGTLSERKIYELGQALSIALGVENTLH
jgi:mRNA interferase MazF